MIDITCKTDRFNLSVVGPEFINDCCFGEDFSKWLAEVLPAAGVEADLICMEDFGWANVATCQGRTYLMCIAGNSDGLSDRSDYGQWHVMFERERTFMQKLLGKNKISTADPVIDKVAEVLRSAGFEEVSIEP